MKKDYSITPWFGANLAELLSGKIEPVFAGFESAAYIKGIAKEVEGKSYTERIILHAHALQRYLPKDYPRAVNVLRQILGPENTEETGMFKNFYWLMPAGKYVELFGLEYPELSFNLIEEITKRNTGEYAIRPYIRKYPELTIKRMAQWAQSDSFHLRRLASEGLRPKLPWAPKLDTFVNDPAPVFEILEWLREDPVKFVQKSVANHLTDYLKVNEEPAIALLKRWNKSDNKYTKWIVKHATRKFELEP